MKKEETEVSMQQNISPNAEIAQGEEQEIDGEETCRRGG